MMTKSRDSSQREPKTLLSAFAGWSPQKDEIRRRAFESGLVVLDANILLAFYEVGSAAREEIISILEKQGTRLWVPHQAALEFSRNRSEVVTKRLAQFSDVRRSVKSATTEAIDILEAAISRVLLLRDQNRTARAWDLAAFNLDRDALDHRLDGALDAALEELIKLETEHDTHPSQPDRADEILDRISTLLIKLAKPSVSTSCAPS
jgi:hypothetical protein